MPDARGTRVPPSHVTSLRETNLKRRTACTVRTDTEVTIRVPIESYNNSGPKIMTMKDYKFKRSKLTSLMIQRELLKKDSVDLTGIIFHHFDMYEHWSSTGKFLTYP
jgi:hypothetical protein